MKENWILLILVCTWMGQNLLHYFYFVFSLLNGLFCQHFHLQRFTLLSHTVHSGFPQILIRILSHPPHGETLRTKKQKQQDRYFLKVRKNCLQCLHQPEMITNLTNKLVFGRRALSHLNQLYFANLVISVAMRLQNIKIFIRTLTLQYFVRPTD